MDSTLLEEGLQQPLSVLGERWMEDAIVAMCRHLTGRGISTRDPDGLVLTIGGRWYANVSNLLWLGTERIAHALEPLDVHAAGVLRTLDPRHYRRAARQRPTLGSIARTVAGTIRCPAAPAGRTLVALARPERADRRYRAAVAEHHKRLVEVTRAASSVPDLAEQTLRLAIHLLMREGLPLTVAAEAATSLIRTLYRRADNRQQERLDAALRAMPNNVTIAMGLALYELARAVGESEGQEAFTDLPSLARRIDARELPTSVLSQWDAFMYQYGFRGPNELDLAAPRYADDSTIVLRQLRQYAQLAGLAGESPPTAAAGRQRERRAAFRELVEHTPNPFTRWLVVRLYRTAETFSGYRESHKYHLVHAGYQVRRRALELGQQLVAAGRLDTAEQVFDLTDDDLCSANDADDLRERAAARSSYRSQVRTLGARFPVVVDSRGHIPRPAPTYTGPGVLTGEGVSPGTVSGPANVLRHVGEKPVQPGDILVARATDPGWTPLFVPATGIVLETGGSFQHGALVAREYGKPCLVGIADATDRIHDGQLVELDGTSGTLTVLAERSDESDWHAP